ncbi:haloacid dehalogenase-like hydrolase [Candidatus Kaiserbacteria bacterium]|nr:haloacid dehalogenase-like hydrolase [Candidatus Kaiserbacteria bacterium]
MEVPPGVSVPRTDVFSKKIEALRSDGVSRLHVVTDFDQTLTTEASSNPEIRNSSWGVLESPALQAASFIEAYKKNYATYSPVIWDDSIPYVERDKLLHEWYENVREVMREHGITHESLMRAARSDILLPRPGLGDFFSTARRGAIPVVVFSAGLGDVIEEYLRYRNITMQGVSVIANFHEYDEHGLPQAFRSGIIHSLNKNEAHGAYDVHEMASARPNVLLMGDFEHDIHMADGETHDTVLSVGFLNGRSNLLRRFQEVFDAVILDDVGLDFPTSILAELETTES